MTHVPPAENGRRGEPTRAARLAPRPALVPGVPGAGASPVRPQQRDGEGW